MNAERVGSFLWLLFGLAVTFGSVQLGLGTLQAPGSGFLGFLAGVFVTLMALLVMVSTFVGQGNQGKLSALWKEVNWWRPAAVAILILFYVLALEKLGFLLTSLLFLLILFKWVEKFSWPKAGFVTLSAVVLSYLLFHTFLKASLPQGIFGF
jgi:putative tricarboxylic transport membrane protein